MPPILDRRSDNFDERNPLLWLVLGLLSVGRRLETLVAPHAGADAPATDEGSSHPWDDAVLGAIALQRQVVAHLERACPTIVTEKPPAQVAEVAAETLRGLLR